ncbi:hypothetical protein E1301_Tti014578 [Triplophysa tibetana]|uniref:Uncharacterized protein n=1 Tax=Triplophysa tibetana TaxID=1572043 RepID=A0A5A9P7M3_9TELE|nr:hypothetical protein E1301_Tti014578 [Triplophysa tibetana]
MVTPFVPQPDSEESNPKVLPDVPLDNNPRLEADEPHPKPAGACTEVSLMVTDTNPAVPLQKTGPYHVKLGLMSGVILELTVPVSENHKPMDTTGHVNPESKKETKPANRETNADIDQARPAKLWRK